MTVPADPQPPGVGRRLIAAIGAQGLSHVVLVLGQLLSVPAFLAAWGAETFADWLVLSAAAGMMVLSDLGVHGYLANTLRAAWARGDEVAGRRILQSGLGVYVVLNGLTVAALVAALGLLEVPALLGVARQEGAEVTLLLLALTNILLLPRGLVAAVHSARGHFHREIMALLLSQVAQTGAGILAALAGGTPLLAAAAQFAAGLLFGWGVLVRELRRCYGPVPLRPQWPTSAEVRCLLAKAPLYAVQQNSVAIMVNAPVLLLGHLAPPAAVVAFTTARTFTGIVRQTARQIGTSVGLEMARMHATGDDRTAARLYAASVPPVGCAVALLAGAAWAAGPAVFALWTHGTTSFDPLTGAAFLAGALLQVPAYGAAGLLRFVDRPGVVALIHATEIVVTVALGLLLIPWGGAAGAALGVVIAETTASTPWNVHAASRLLGVPMLRPVARGYAAAAVLLALVVLATLAAERVAPLATLPGLTVFLALWGVIATLAPFATLDGRYRAEIRGRLLRGLRRAP